ncbi:C-terminal helicase domain-containing protein [Rhodococcus sp. NCIMB 12038]|uniref:helicase-related protein n=1 Tax=Rhodococcus sp. NCIMB 12038 TaxID=933800 RepID=UPI00211AE3B1|nr:C-terminal helicase domain-containing protein [Rhodococcus sp. NCIMB 12038]
MSADDTTAYRDAVAAGNFMRMRQVAMLQGERSEKVQRLVEIVEDNGRRVIVFSHFRGVLDQVVRALPGQVFGPLTGSVPAAARQTMVDQFSAAGHGAVLVSKIVAGGVGLNIQAASVVVICEPQLKPTAEWQAIARARRMGQLESVQVHRLLSEEGVDQRITAILARKRELFDEFAQATDRVTAGGRDWLAETRPGTRAVIDRRKGWTSIPTRLTFNSNWYVTEDYWREDDANVRTHENIEVAEAWDAAPEVGEPSAAAIARLTSPESSVMLNQIDGFAADKVLSTRVARALVERRRFFAE